MMKNILIFLFSVLLLVSATLFAQQPRARVAVVSMVDTTATHIYGNRWYSSADPINIFDYGKFSVEGLTNIFWAENIDAFEVYYPSWINKMAMLNLVGKPSKDMVRWFEILKEDYGADYIVVIFRKFEPEDKISHRYLNGKQYGVASYSRYPDVISIFSFVGYYIFSIDRDEEIKINANHDRYLLMDLRLDERISYKLLKDLPEKYLDLTADKMKNLVNTRNVEIKRAILQDMNQH